MTTDKTNATAVGGSDFSEGLGPKAPEWALHIAAQCWCEPTTSMIEMDSRLAFVFAEKLAAEREACAKVCEDTDQEYEAFTGTPKNLGYTCAAAIRKRSNVC